LKKGPKDTHRPIIVRFVTKKMRGSVMRAKKILREDGLREIYLSEHLTPTASLLFKETRALVRGKKIASSWTMNGKVFYKKMLTPNEKPTMVSCATDLPK